MCHSCPRDRLAVFASHASSPGTGVDRAQLEGDTVSPGGDSHGGGPLGAETPHTPDPARALAGTGPQGSPPGSARLVETWSGLCLRAPQPAPSASVPVTPCWQPPLGPSERPLLRPSRACAPEVPGEPGHGWASDEGPGLVCGPSLLRCVRLGTCRHLGPCQPRGGCLPAGLVAHKRVIVLSGISLACVN